MTSLAVLGAGNAGCSLAGEASLLGFDVSLAELPQFKANLEAPLKKGGIEVTGELQTGFAKIDQITLKIGEAIEGRNLIFITTPAFGHEPFTKACLPYLKDDQCLVYISYFAALRMAKLLKDLGVRTGVTVAETSSFVYACDRVGRGGAFFMERYQDDAKVVIKREKSELPFAAFPATNTPRALRKVKEVLPSITEAKNVLETSIHNVNTVTHPAGVLMNAGWIEHTKGKFSFYLEGQTPAVQRVGKAMDGERTALAGAFGLEQTSEEEWDSRMYAKYKDKKTGQVFQEKYYKGVFDAPPSLNHRYLTEDIIYGLVPMSSLAKVAGIKTPTFDSIITLAGIANHVDYWAEGITLDKLGLQSMSVNQIIEFTEKGEIRK
ncbi:MAG: NAD/NADP octopine/nopaline dehydrogenase family protein [Candidatus Bathyarchaeia archaeon]